jgi:hypothetical protein
VTPDYHPLLPGLTLYYVHVGYDCLEPTVERFAWKVEEVREAGGVKTARVSTRRGAQPSKSHELRLDSQGLWLEKSLELKLPAVLGESWTAQGDAYPLRRVLALKARAAAVAKEFEGCLEVGLASEDTDSGSRWYSPGLGLVMERWSGENRNTVLSLVHWTLPSA